ncbi:hypothetical protein CDA09_15380 [Azoarcus sp. DN11]|nr:hypothetical protein CDA09_15380 [Azoarcus sp. DN11]
MMTPRAPRHPTRAFASIPFARQFLLACAAGLLSAGCSTSGGPGDEHGDEKYQLEWPGPPSPARFAYETRLRSEADIRPETDDGRMRKVLTGKGSVSDERAFRKPAAIAASNGRIYVADPPTGAIVVFDAQRARAFRMGLREPNRVQKPVALAIDGQNRVYVLDGRLRRVLVFDALGLFQFAVGDPKALTQPAGLAVSQDGQRIFVVDRGSVDGEDHKVVAYSPDNRELFRIGPRGAAPGFLNIPLAAAVSRAGKLLVLDSGNFRVQAFDLDGKYISQFGSVGNGLGQFSRPRGIAVDPAGNIYVSDASFNNVQIFNPAGDLLMWIGAPGTSDFPGKFALIAGVAVDETGRLYVVDQFHLKIEVYRPVQEAKRGS